MLITEKGFSNVITDNAPFIKIPVLDYVQAGVFGSVGYDGINPIGETYTTYHPIRPEDIFSLKVEGESMLPVFRPVII